MARYCGEERAESKLNAAEDFKTRCLLEGRSLVSSEDVWTAERVEELNTYFVGNLDAGEGDFFSKLETQLNLATPNAKQLFAEMLWFMLLCPSNIGVASKLDSIRKIFSLSERNMDDLFSPTDREKYLSEEVLSGIGSAGVAFNTNRWREFVYFIRFAALFLVLPLDERRELLSDHQQFSKWLERIPENETRQLRHMMLYLFFPDEQERIFGGTDRKSILVKFTDITSAQYNKLSAREVDERLYSLRLSLELEYQTKELDYYLQPLASRWKDSPLTAWFVGPYVDGEGDQTDRFCSEGVWENSSTGKLLDKVEQIKAGDRIALKTTYTKKNDLPFEANGNTASVMGIRAIGVVTENVGDGRHFKVDWQRLTEKKEWYFYTIREPVWEVKPGQERNDALIDFTFNDAPQDYGLFLNHRFWSDRFGDRAINEPTNSDQETLSKMPLNTILYGPPGTGKTYHTIDRALQVLAPDYLESNRENRRALKERFDQFVSESRIGFVTFHQSFSYEDFVEGLKATTEGGQIAYEVADGIFKRMCEEVCPNIEKESSKLIDVSDKTIWKMSLGNTLGSDSYVYDKCIESDEMRLGYGDDLDFAGCDSRSDISAKFIESGYELKPQVYQVTSVDTFKNQMNTGDLVIVSDGNLKFRAIGEIASEYQCSPYQDLADYGQMRKVIWHRVYEKSLPYERVMHKKFSQMTLYKLSRKTVDVAKLQSLLERTDKTGTSKGGATQEKRVLIIDEINRGNISSIFGELITLIEPSKRAGAEEALSVTLPYSKETFQVPSNLYLIGTMNTADRSLALMDTALRRRFDFVEMMPDISLLDGVTVKGIDVARMLLKMNQRIEVLYDREHTLGHAFFMQMKDVVDEDQRFALLQSIFANRILPLLEEYFFEDWAKIRLVLGDDGKDTVHQFITANGKDYDAATLFGKNVDPGYELEEQKTYARNDEALAHPEAYLGIYAE